MTTKILSDKKIPKINKLKKKFNIFRAIVIKSERDIQSVEFMNSKGVFRGFGKSTKEAYQNAKKILKKYYQNSDDKNNINYNY
jgi:predicted RNase H-like HicB family nuclease